MSSFFEVCLTSSYPRLTLSLLSIRIKASAIWYVTYLAVLVPSRLRICSTASKAGTGSPFCPALPSGADKPSVRVEIKGRVLVDLVHHHIPCTWHLAVTNNTYLNE